MPRMGSKGRYAHAILARMGLQPGEGAERFVWCDADDGARLLMRSYLNRDMRNEAARTLRSFRRQTTDARRRLWQQLKEQGPLRVGPAATGSELARWMRVCGSNRLVNLCPQTWRNTGSGGSTFGGDQFFTLSGHLADRLEATSMFDGTPAQFAVHACVCSAMAVVQTAVRRQSMRGVRVLIDPPYEGTSPYAHTYPHAQVVQDALQWQEVAGPQCVVAVCESEPVAELVERGWHATEITHESAWGSKKFSRSKREWMTISVRPFGPTRLFG